jgi:hypothetical protein
MNSVPEQELMVTNTFVPCAQCGDEPAVVHGQLVHDHDCVGCDDGAPAVDDLGYCGHCHWSKKTELSEGLHFLQELLENHSRFYEWCSNNGRLR